MWFLHALVNFGNYAVLIGLPLLILKLHWSCRTWLRVVCAVFLPWFVGVVYTIGIYNPVEQTYYKLLSDETAMYRFDNNTVASVILGGWIAPAIVVLIYFLWLKFRYTKVE